VRLSVSKIRLAWLLGLCFSCAASAKSMVFEVSRDGNTSYLGGTLHILRESDYPLPAEFTGAYERSDVIVLETDLSVSGHQNAGHSMLAEFQLGPGITAQSMLTSKNWGALLEAGRKVGFPVELYSDKHPAFHSLTLLRLCSDMLGAVSGVDAHFFGKSQEDKKPVLHLETIQAQVDSLGSLMLIDPNQMITSTLNDAATLKTLLATLIGHWKVGDTKSLTDELLVPMRDESPEAYYSLIVDRNGQWMPQIKSMLKTPTTEFVLVGSAHLLGKHGLLKQLNDAGYHVRYFQP
jgi:uncharacterized protein YbaP (TraB family)